MRRGSKRNFTVSMLLMVLLLINGVSCTYAQSKVLISKPKFYPSTLKTAEDLSDWVMEVFKYIPDKTIEDSFKTPEQTLKDGGGDCEGLAIIAYTVLKDLGYKNVFLVAIISEEYGHGLTWFQDKDGKWSFFSTGITSEGNEQYFYNRKYDNPMYILGIDFPEWAELYACSIEGDCIIALKREKDEGSKK